MEEPFAPHTTWKEGISFNIPLKLKNKNKNIVTGEMKVHILLLLYYLQEI